MQAGQRGLDDGEDLLEFVVPAVIGIVDVEGVGTRPGVERAQHAQSRILDTELAQQPSVVAAQGNYQVCRQMPGIDLRGAVLGGVAVGAQHPPGPLVDPVADMPVAGAGTAHPHGISQPALPELVGEHLLGHRRTADVAGAHEGDVQGWRIRHPTPPAARRWCGRA